jgi:predicted ATP-grasp superfamily ATP-dependent carboligase
LGRLGEALARGSGLRGLFGVDFVLRGDLPWTVEVNPRYTASMEVVEHTSGLPLMALHRRQFQPRAERRTRPLPAVPGCVGKAVWFARDPLVFPPDGPWHADLRPDRPLEALPAFADIPKAGQSIRAGEPVVTFFSRAATAEACLEELRRIAADLDRRLCPP